jgi:hypothetical protein
MSRFYPFRAFEKFKNRKFGAVLKALFFGPPHTGAEDVRPATTKWQVRWRLVKKYASWQQRKLARFAQWHVFTPVVNVNINVIRLVTRRVHKNFGKFKRIARFVQWHTGATPAVTFNENIVRMKARRSLRSWTKRGKRALFFTPILHTGPQAVGRLIQFTTRRRKVTRRKGRRAPMMMQWHVSPVIPVSGIVPWVTPWIRSSVKRGNA